MTAKYQAQIDKKDKEIEFLRATVKKLEVSVACKWKHKVIYFHDY